MIISKSALEMMDKAVENIKKGIVSDSIDLEEVKKILKKYADNYESGKSDFGREASEYFRNKETEG